MEQKQKRSPEEQKLYDLYSLWIKLKRWSAEEASCLYIGIDPDSLNVVHTGDKVFEEIYREGFYLIKKCLDPEIGYPEILIITPTSFIDWCQKKKIYINPMLLKAYEDFNANDDTNHSKNVSKFEESKSWVELKSKTETAVKAFPKWCVGKRFVNKANITGWLKSDLKYTERDAYFVTKVLAELFENIIKNK